MVVHIDIHSFKRYVKQGEVHMLSAQMRMRMREMRMKCRFFASGTSVKHLVKLGKEEGTRGRWAVPKLAHTAWFNRELSH